MLDRVVNVPNCTDLSDRILCRIDLNGDYQLHTYSGNLVCLLRGSFHPEQTAADIAILANSLVAIGFNQGRAYVHHAMTGRIKLNT